MGQNGLSRAQPETPITRRVIFHQKLAEKGHRYLSLKDNQITTCDVSTHRGKNEICFCLCRWQLCNLRRQTIDEEENALSVFFFWRTCGGEACNTLTFFFFYISFHAKAHSHTLHTLLLKKCWTWSLRLRPQLAAVAEENRLAGWLIVGVDCWVGGVGGVTASRGSRASAGTHSEWTTLTRYLDMDLADFIAEKRE